MAVNDLVELRWNGSQKSQVIMGLVRIFAGSACTGNAGNVFLPAADFKENR